MLHCWLVMDKNLKLTLILRRQHLLLVVIKSTTTCKYPCSPNFEAKLHLKRNWRLIVICWFGGDGDLDLGFTIAFVKISVQNYIHILLSTTRFECGLDIMTFYLKLCVRFCSRFDVTFPGLTFRQQLLWLLWFWFFLISCKFCLILQWHQRIHRGRILWILPVPRQVKHSFHLRQSFSLEPRINVSRSQWHPVSFFSGILFSDWSRSHNAGMGGCCDWLRPRLAPNDVGSQTQTDGGMCRAGPDPTWAGAGAADINHSSSDFPPQPRTPPSRVNTASPKL